MKKANHRGTRFNKEPGGRIFNFRWKLRRIEGDCDFAEAGAAFDVVDIFDARVMTEASIGQARRMERGAIVATPAPFDDLPFNSGTFDATFCIFAAHELRRDWQRATLFLEIARVLIPGGELVLMEHSRDWWNLLAFGPGFFHFFSQSAWRRSAAKAGFGVQTELSMTPFVHVYVLRRTM